MAVLFLPNFEAGKESFQSIQRFASFGLQDGADISQGVGHIADGFWHDGPGGIRMTAALQFFRDLQGAAVAAAETGEVPSGKFFQNSPLESCVSFKSKGA